MSLVGRLHNQYVHSRRVRVLCECISELLPQASKVLDVGCGDGLLARLIMQQRPDLEVSGIDVLVRSNTMIPVSDFDGSSIPFPDRSFDVVMFVDVLHHTEHPDILLREAARVTSKAILIKDHRLNGLLARQTLSFMDWLGNARHEVSLPYNYWRHEAWTQAFVSLNLEIETWKTDLQLYPPLANLIFGRSLHFVARLSIKTHPD